MSLDIELRQGNTVWKGNLTHNLTQMANAAGLYQCVWYPKESGLKTAAQLAPLLESGLARLKSDPEHYKTFDPPNGWGDYDRLVTTLEAYWQACKDNPESLVMVWR